MKKILAAMSGGVDSAATALLLQRAGYEVEGATMLLRDGAKKDLEDAARVCQTLGIPFHAFDFRAEFEKLVMEPFQAVYQAGGTPNPCVVCNQKVKFGLLLDRAMELGFDGIATGHYARIAEQGGRFLLKTAVESGRDQSYFLYALTQEQLRHTLFPLGTYRKDEVRAMAEQAQLPVARKHDSQDICFVPDGNYFSFLRERGMQPQTGDFILEGRRVARHQGMESYTIGQRRGLEFAAGRRVYVTGKQGGDVLLGENEALFSHVVYVEQMNYIALEAPNASFEAECKLRSGPRRARCLVEPTLTGAILRFSEPQRAVTPGQAAVLYQDDTVLAGGTIVGAAP